MSGTEGLAGEFASTAITGDPSHFHRRLGILETETSVIKRDIGELRSDIKSVSDGQHSFYAEWRKQNDDEARERAQVAQSSKLSLPQIIGMGAGIVTMTAALFAVGLFMIKSETGTVQLSLNGESAKIALQIRGQQDNIMAAQTGLQSIQRDIGSVQVKLGLVEQLASRADEFLKEMQRYDALIARQDEKQKALSDQVRALSQKLEKPQ